MKQKKEKERSMMAKCGSMVKTLMIYGAVAGVVGPMIYSLYKERMQSAEADEFEEMARRASSSEEQMNPEDIRKQAEEQEAEEMAKQRERMGEYMEVDKEETEEEQELELVAEVEPKLAADDEEDFLDDEKEEVIN